MVNNRKFNKNIRIWIDDGLDNKLKALAASRGEHVSVIVRRLLEQALDGEAAVSSIDFVGAAVSNVIRREIKPLEDRLSKINAKTSIAGATAMYMLVQVLDDLGIRNSVEIYEKARIKAVSFLKEPAKNTVSVNQK